MANQKPGADCPTTPSSRAVRECDCPEWVIRCCHFDGRILIFASGVARNDAHARLCTSTGAYIPYSVGITNGYRPCRDGCGTLRADGGSPSYSGGSEHEALAAFYAAEAELLARPIQPFPVDQPRQKLSDREFLAEKFR